VLPALVINYFGQGALLLTNPDAIANPFYRLVPEVLLLPMVILATCATVIASQAVITGAYSLTYQAIQLGLLPRLAILHTSAAHFGRSTSRASTQCCSAACCCWCSRSRPRAGSRMPTASR
jgi:KUP system potassium uptake protein